MKKIIKRSSRFYLEVIILCMLCFALFSASSFASTPSGEIDIYPTKVPVSNDAFILHYKVQGLTASVDHHIKGRIKQGSSYFGATWNESTASWKKQTDSWSTMPVFRSNSSGDLEGYLYLKSSASLMESATLDLEISLRSVGSTVNIGPFAAINIESYKVSATGDGIHVLGMAYLNNLEPAENKLVIGKNSVGSIVCAYSTENNNVAESSVDIPGSFSLPCPSDAKNIEIYDLDPGATSLGSADLPTLSPAGSSVSVFINGITEGGSDIFGPSINDIALSSMRITTADTLNVSLTASDALKGNSAIVSAQYAITGLEEADSNAPVWEVMAPTDGSFDSSTEFIDASIKVSDLSSGQYRLRFRVSDSQGNLSVIQEKRFSVFDVRFSDDNRGSEFYFSNGGGMCVFEDKNDKPVFSGMCELQNNRHGYFVLKERSGRSLLLGSLSLSKNKAFLMVVKAQKTKKTYFLRDTN